MEGPISVKIAPIVKTPDEGYVLNYCYDRDPLDNPFLPGESILIKLDQNFKPLWQKSLDAIDGENTFIYDDGSILIYGANGIIEKINSNGMSQWKKFPGSFYPNQLCPVSGVKSGSDQLIFACTERIFDDQMGGLNNSLGVLLKMDTAGNILLTKYFSFDQSLNRLFNLITDKSGNIYITGETYYAPYKGYIAKFNANFDPIWCKQIKHDMNHVKLFFSSELSNSDILFGGSIQNSTGTYNPVLSRFNPDGEQVWGRIYESTALMENVQELADSTLQLSGIDTEAFPDRAITILRTDPYGHPISTTATKRASQVGPPMLLNSNQWYFPAFNDDPFIFNTDKNGHSDCNYTELTISDSELSFTVNDIFIITRIIYYNNQTYFNSDTASEHQAYVEACNYALEISDHSSKLQPYIYPNPSSGKISISSSEIIKELSVIDELGREIETIKPLANEIKLELHADGVYTVQIQTKLGISTQKVLIFN